MAKTKPKHNHQVINQTINFFWTILCMAPVYWFWAIEDLNLYFYLFAGIALVMGILPERILSAFTFSSRKEFYENLGVKFIRKYVQNGTLAKSMSDPHTHKIINNKSEARKYLKSIQLYERYHWICLIFFLLTAVYSFLQGNLIAVLLILGVNILYNLCPLMLQQYNKLRLLRIL